MGAGIGRENHHVGRVGERDDVFRPVLGDRGERGRVDAPDELTACANLLYDVGAARMRLVCDVVHGAGRMVLDEVHALRDDGVRPPEGAAAAVVAAQVEHGGEPVGADLVERGLRRVDDDRLEAELGDARVVGSGRRVDAASEGDRVAGAGIGSRLGGRAREADRQRDGCNEEQPDAHRGTSLLQTPRGTIRQRPVLRREALRAPSPDGRPASRCASPWRRFRPRRSRTSMRLTPQYVLPPNFFSPQTPYCSATSCSGSASSVNGSEYLFLNFTWEATSSGLTPSTTAPRFSKSRVRVAEPAGLDRAARRVVLGIEVEDDRLPAVVRQLDALARVRRQLEIRCRLALFDHLCSPVEFVFRC